MSHIALVIPGLDKIAGAERQVMSLAKGMRCRGWRVSVVALSGAGGNAAAELKAAGVEFLSLEMRKGLADPRGWIRFSRWIERERPQVVHAHLPHAAWLARWSRLATPGHGWSGLAWPGLASSFYAVIDTLHSSSTGKLLRRIGYRFSDWLADGVTAVSQSVADAHIAAGMVDRNKLTVFWNGVDVEEFRPDAQARETVRRELGLNGDFLWLAAGRLETVKDYPTLLHAFARVPEPARLLIAGDGTLQSELCRLSARLGLERRVRFLGFQSDVKPWMQAADGFVLTSRWEGLPVGLLEAGACALPSIATDVPGSREVIVSGRTGRLTPCGAPNALAGEMIAMAQSSPQERRAMGNLARLHITERFSLDAMLDRWENLYRSLLAYSYLTNHGVRDPVPAQRPIWMQNDAIGRRAHPRTQ
jgi:glycosyltransferase involved in cell wall biosynthesis